MSRINVCRKLQNPWHYFFFLIRTSPHQNSFKLRLTSPKLIQIASHPIKIIQIAICNHDFSTSSSAQTDTKTHRFLKWRFIAFWNENSSLFEIKIHHFFSLIHLDHHITFYNTYDHRWVSILHTFDDIQENFFICMKKIENGLLIDFHTDEKISLHVIRCTRNWHSTMIVDIIEIDVIIEMSQKKKRWVLIWKSDEFLFEKAMSSHFNKAMNSHFKKRWVLISRSDESPFQKAMSSHFKKRWIPVSKSDESERKSDSSIQHLMLRYDPHLSVYVIISMFLSFQLHRRNDLL
jgi:hypothetical protein